MARHARALRQMELGLCPVPALGRTRGLGWSAANAGRAGAHRRLAAHDRQRPCLGCGRKRGDAANAFGRSRGGFTCKVHARSDNQGRPLGFLLTGGEASDYAAAEPLMKIPVAKPKALLADKGYDGDRFRESLLIQGILPIIPRRSNRKAPEHPTIGATGIATASSVCSANSSNSAASQHVTTNPPCPSRASSTSPPS